MTLDELTGETTKVLPCHRVTTDPTTAPKAMAKMPHLAEDFLCDPAKPHYGFTSWDGFFTRRFRPVLMALRGAT